MLSRADWALCVACASSLPVARAPAQGRQTRLGADTSGQTTSVPFFQDKRGYVWGQAVLYCVTRQHTHTHRRRLWGTEYGEQS